MNEYEKKRMIDLAVGKVLHNGKSNKAAIKKEEAALVGAIWSMGAQSLDPETYTSLELALRRIIENRNLSPADVDAWHIATTGNKHD